MKEWALTHTLPGLWSSMIRAGNEAWALAHALGPRPGLWSSIAGNEAMGTHTHSGSKARAMELHSRE